MILSDKGRAMGDPRSGLRPGLLYLAYGCNMDPAFLARVVGARPAPGWPARVEGWRLAFNKGGEEGAAGRTVANLMEAPGCAAFGVVYRLPREALGPLDEFEGTPEHYRRATLWVEPVGRRARQAAVAYVAQPAWVGREASPPSEYLQTLLCGAEAHGLPADYRDWLARKAADPGIECYPSAPPSGATDAPRE